MNLLYIYRFHSSHESGKTFRKLFLSSCPARAGQLNTSGALYIVPFDRLARQRQYEILREKPSGLFSPAISTLKSLARTWQKELLPGKKILSPFNRNIIVNSIFANLKDRLIFFRDLSSRSGYTDRLGELISELKQNGIRSAGELEQRLTRIRGRSLSEKDHDILLLFTRYETVLKEKGLLDSEDLLLAVADKFSPSLLGTKSLALIEGFYSFTQPELAFLKKIIEAIPLTSIGFVTASPGGRARNSIVEETIQEIKSLFSTTDTVKVIEKETGEPVHNPAKVYCSSFPGPVEETEAIACRIKALIHQNPGLDLDEVAVSFPSLDKYAGVVRETFTRAGLPFHISHTYKLKYSPVFALLKNMVALALNNYGRRELVRLLRSPYLNLVSAPDPSFLERLCIEKIKVPPWNDDADAQSWKQYLVQPLENYLRQNNGEWYSEKLARAIEFLNRFFPLVSGLHGTRKPKEFESAFHQIFGIDFLDIERRIKESLTGEIAPVTVETELKSFKMIIRGLQELSKFLDDRPMPLKNYYDILEKILEPAGFFPKDCGNYGINIVSSDELRMAETRYNFFGGLNEEVFPPPRMFDIFYPQEIKKKLGLKIDQPYLECRQVFSEIVAGSDKTVYLSYPETNGEKPALASPILREKEFRPWPEQSTQPVPARVSLSRVGKILTSRGSRPGPEFQAALASSYLGREDEFRELLRLARAWNDRSGIYDGMIGPETLEENFNRLAVTGVENFAQCPFSFFAGYLLNLKDLEDLERTITAREKGSLLHRILSKFYDPDRDRFSSAVPDFQAEHRARQKFAVTADNFDEARKRLLTVAKNEIFSQGKWLNRYYLEREYENLVRGLRSDDDGQQQRPGLLKIFLDREKEWSQGLVPFRLEHSFEWSSPAGTTFCGRIDRIDTGPDGRFIIIDYKTGNPPDKKEIESFVIFQVLVYLLAGESVLRQIYPEVKFRPVGGGYYCFKATAPDKMGRERFLLKQSELDPAGLTGIENAGKKAKPDPDFDALLDRTREVLEAIREKMNQGQFHVTLLDMRKFKSIDSKCEKYCEFRDICRFDPDRVREFLQKFQVETAKTEITNPNLVIMK